MSLSLYSDARLAKGIVILYGDRVRVELSIHAFSIHSNEKSARLVLNDRCTVPRYPDIRVCLYISIAIYIRLNGD